MVRGTSLTRRVFHDRDHPRRSDQPAAFFIYLSDDKKEEVIFGDFLQVGVAGMEQFFPGLFELDEEISLDDFEILPIPHPGMTGWVTRSPWTSMGWSPIE